MHNTASASLSLANELLWQRHLAGRVSSEAGNVRVRNPCLKAEDFNFLALLPGFRGPVDRLIAASGRSGLAVKVYASHPRFRDIDAGLRRAPHSLVRSVADIHMVRPACGPAPAEARDAQGAGRLRVERVGLPGRLARSFTRFDPEGCARNPRRECLHYLALRRGRVVGRFTLIQGPWVGLYDFDVAERCRNQGIGASLLAWMAAAFPGRTLYTQTWATNPARRLYAAAGFEEADRSYYYSSPRTEGRAHV